jgi:hypothetical protein
MSGERELPLDGLAWRGVLLESAAAREPGKPPWARAISPGDEEQGAGRT